MNNDNQVKIVQAGAMAPLVELLRHGDAAGKAAAAGALRNLAVNNDNEVKMKAAGVELNRSSGTVEVDGVTMYRF